MDFTTLHPMLASMAEVTLTDPQFVYEPKYDGNPGRGFFCEAGGRTVRMMSRRGNEKTGQFPDLVRALKQFACKLKASVIVDGEIVTLSENIGGQIPDSVIDGIPVKVAVLLSTAVHNHLSGDPQPSPDDLELTHRLIADGETLGIAILDHVILGEGRCYSFGGSEKLIGGEAGSLYV